MKRKVQVYLSDEELAQLRRAAAARRQSLSRYAKERLAPAADESGGELAVLNAGGLSPAAEQRLADSVRKAIAVRVEGLSENLRTVMVMLDQLVRSTLTHLPEIPAAQQKERLAAGERRHRGWQQEVENLLRQLRAEATGDQRNGAGNGVHA
ncbi:MAG: hypothetical protein ACLQFW_11535 [Xanthobacteraceae bacterium]